jgi:hypothetical protein
MRALTASDMLQIWELGQNRHPIDRALTILAVAMPDRNMDELARLCIGDRDGWLLRLREMTLGAQFVGMAQCPQCGEELELAMNIRDFGFTEPELVVVPEQTIHLEEFVVQVHLPNSHDLAAVVSCRDLETADRLLLQSCIISVDKLGESVSIDALPSEILDRISAQIAELDPRSEIILAPICPACEYSWQVLFDIVTFFWTELSVRAKQLMQEVAVLARAYGWREADILAMSPIRRQFYIDVVT